MRIPLVKSGFYKEEKTRKDLANFVLRTPRFSMGEECAKFEEAFSRFQSRKHSVFVSSGSAANLLLLQSLLNRGLLRRGDAIGFSALTWATNIMPIIELGLRPVALDCTVDTLNVSSISLKERIEDIQALFLTNVLGFCDDLDRIRNDCCESKVLLLEDNCESLGSSMQGEMLGNFSYASTFSFFVGHHLSTIEGGMVCTDNTELHDMLVMTRAHGWDRNLSREAQQAMRTQHAVDAFYAAYTFYDLAYNVRPTELQGFLGAQQMQYLQEIIDRRVKHFERFHAAIISCSDRYIPLRTTHMDTISNFAMPVLCRTEQEYRKTIDRFHHAGVEIRPIIAGNMTKQPFYAKYCDPSECPNATMVHRQGFYFGNNPDMTEEEVTMLCSLLTSHE